MGAKSNSGNQSECDDTASGMEPTMISETAGSTSCDDKSEPIGPSSP